MTIERVKDEILIRVPASVNTDGIQDIIDLIVYREATSKSQATQKDVDLLVSEIKQNRWDKLKHKVINK